MFLFFFFLHRPNHKKRDKTNSCVQKKAASSMLTAFSCVFRLRFNRTKKQTTQTKHKVQSVDEA